MSERPCEQRILVVDDEVFVRELLEEYFGRLGYEVTTADCGDQGIEAVRADGFGVALVDLKMPGKDGIETLREVRRIDPLCMIIIMTGYPTIDSSIEALRAGAYDYIIKPFKLGELREVVERAVKEYRLKVEIDRMQRNVASVEGELRDYRTAIRNNNGSADTDGSSKREGYIQAQMRELDRLHEAGYLSNGEFEDKKRDLLSHS
jgi:DNA-binding NtrC family response regulator